MSKWVEYDPLSGITNHHDYNEETGKLTIARSQDVTSILERAKSIRNDSAADLGIKKGFWHYCTIPVTIQLELKKKGLDVFSQDQTMTNRIIKEINQNYPYLKMTQKHHE